MAEETKTLVVTADDLGLSEGINRGIVSAYQNGIVRSASIMPSGAAFDDAVTLVRGLSAQGQHPGPVKGRYQSLGVGVHITLTGERCVAPREDLRHMVNDAGLLPGSYGDFTRQFLSRRFGFGEVGSELRAQLDRVLEAGIEPTHIDSHQHVHMLPALFAMVLDLAREYDIPVVRVPLESGPNPAGISVFAPKAWLLVRIRRTRVQEVQKAGLRTAGWFVGLEASGQMNEANLMKALEGLGPGVTEIMCHPGVSDPTVTEHYRWGYAWDEELAALQSDTARRFIEENNIRLASFADAWEGSPCS